MGVAQNLKTAAGVYFSAIAHKTADDAHSGLKVQLTHRKIMNDAWSPKVQLLILYF